VHVLKYEGGSWLLNEIACLLAENPDWQAYFAGAVLVPIPLHPRKLRSRGYNQSLVIAHAIHRFCPDTRIVEALARTRMTPSQTFLSREKRLKNMKGAFACLKGVGQLEKVILVDDVLTTGATLNASALALRGINVQDISAFTLAHG
jgi:ComF family protein